jgi:hypothetical protein
MLYVLVGTFYGARDILKSDSLGGELSADLGKSAVIRPVSMKRWLRGDGLTPAVVGAFEKARWCASASTCVLRREHGKAPRVEHRFKNKPTKLSIMKKVPTFSEIFFVLRAPWIKPRRMHPTFMHSFMARLLIVSEILVQVARDPELNMDNHITPCITLLPVVLSRI